MNWFSKLIFILAILWTLGCGEDPILEQARNAKKEEQKKSIPQEEDSNQKISMQALPKIAPPEKSALTAFPNEMPKVEPPQRVQEGEPPPKPKTQNFVTFEGTITVENWSGKPIRIDVFDGDQRNIGGKRPSVVISEKLNEAGPFSLKIPVEDINVWIGAYIDEDEDGRPGPKDPSGWYVRNPVSTQKDQKGISFSLGLPDDPAP